MDRAVAREDEGALIIEPERLIAEFENVADGRRGLKWDQARDCRKGRAAVFRPRSGGGSAPIIHEEIAEQCGA